jgi:hypothetical protein
MEYRGKRYTVVQGTEAASWKWTVHLDEHTVRSGRAPTRETAKAKAILAIDKARKKPKPTPPGQGGYAGRQLS